jgi:YegS/Rv2252/BmrU family lipid kinase
VRICVIFNPTAKGDKARNFRKQLADFGAQAEMRATTHAGAARELAKAAGEEGFDVVAAAGGDGTVNEVANGIAEAKSGLERCAFAVIPLGTINVFALELGIPFGLQESWETIRAGKERRIDLPVATFRVGEKSVTRHFLQLAGAGWDARAIELVSWKLKKRIGRFAYVWAGMRALSMAKAKVIARAGNERFEGDFALIGNGRLYAGKYPFLHKADLADGLLDATLFPDFGWGSLPGFLTKFVLGKYFRPGSQGYLKAPEIELSSAAVTPFQLDGDFVGHLPAKISILPKALRVIVP